MSTKFPRARLYYLAQLQEIIVVENDKAWIRHGKIRKSGMFAVNYLLKHGGTFVGYV